MTMYFMFTYDEEYVVCDYTRVIGEVGGNLGFLLGSSIFVYFDSVLNFGYNRIGRVEV